MTSEPLLCGSPETSVRTRACAGAWETSDQVIPFLRALAAPLHIKYQNQIYFTVSSPIFWRSLGLLSTSNQVGGGSKKGVQKGSVLAIGDEKNKTLLNYSYKVTTPSNVSFISVSHRECLKMAYD